MTAPSENLSQEAMSSRRCFLGPKQWHNLQHAKSTQCLKQVRQHRLWRRLKDTRRQMKKGKPGTQNHLEKDSWHWTKWDGFVMGRGTGNRPFTSSLLPLFQPEFKCETILMKISSACSFLFMQNKVTFIRMVLHWDSLWSICTRQLGNGLLQTIRSWDDVTEATEPILFKYNSAIEQNGVVFGGNLETSLRQRKSKIRLNPNYFYSCVSNFKKNHWG